MKGRQRDAGPHRRTNEVSGGDADARIARPVNQNLGYEATTRPPRDGGPPRDAAPPPVTSALLIAAATALVIYAALVAGLLIAGRRAHARALARFVPDCAVLFKRLLRDERVPRRHKLSIGLLAGYLVSPIDLVPDFIPVVGQLDDAILVGLVLRSLVRRAGPGLIRDHWPGPDESLRAVLRLAGAPATIDP